MAANSYHYSRPMHIFMWNGYDRKAENRIYVLIVAPNVEMARKVIFKRSRDKVLKKYIAETEPMRISRPTAWVMRGDLDEYEVKFMRR